MGAIPDPSGEDVSGKFERGITLATRALVLILIAALVVVIWISVFTRYVIGDPIAWGEQVAKYIMIWAAFLGGSLGLRDGAHIAVNVFVERFPRRLQIAASVVVLIATSAFLLACVYYGAHFAIRVRSHHDPLVGELSMALPYAAIPVGSALMLLQLYYVTRRGLGRTLSSDQASLS